MLNIIILILAIVVFIFGYPILINYVTRYLRYRASNTQYITLILISFGISIYWESYRTFSFIVFHGIFKALDEFLFIFGTFFIFVGIFITVELTISVIKKSGFDSKTLLIIRTISFLAIPLISILNFFTYSRTEPNNLGIYVFQVHLSLIPIFYLIYLPIALFLSYKIKNTQKEIKNRRTAGIFTIFSIFLIVIVVERLFSVSYIYYYGNDELANILNFSLKSGYFIGLFILIFKFPDFIEFIGVYFDLKSIYLITKNGETVYRFDFQIIDKNLSSTARDLVLGGFIYAISGGLKHVIDVTGELETIKIGNITIIFKFGEKLFGTLITADNTPILEDKLSKFVKEVETEFKEVIDHWVGDISLFKDDEKTIDTIIMEIFR
ncbi:MAG: hypothetical protein ACFFCM_00475 [Promethearchaeota archaeon]